MKGNLNPVIQHFKNEMKEQAANMQFEKAELIRKKISFVENYQSRSIVVNTSLNDVDVFTILKNEDTAYINYLMVQNGAIIQTKTIEVETHLDESLEETLAFTIGQLRTTFNSDAKEIVVPITIDYEETGVVITIPKGGDKKKLLDLSEKNVQYFFHKRCGNSRQNNLDSPGPRCYVPRAWSWSLSKIRA